MNKSILIPLVTAVAGLMFGTLAGGTAGFFAGRTSATSSGGGGSVAGETVAGFDKKKTRTIAEWDGAVLGKTTAEVKTMLGTPDQTIALEMDKVPWWIYTVKYIKKDLAIEGSMMLRIIDGKIIETRYN